MHDFDYEALKSEGEDDIGLDYVFLIFSQFFSDFLSWEKLTNKKKLSKFTRLPFFDIPILEQWNLTKKTFGTLQFGKIGDLVNFIIQELKFSKIALLSFLSVSLMRENLRELRKLRNSKSGQ